MSVPDGVAIATDSRFVAAFQDREATMSDTQQKIVPISTHVAVLTIDPYHLSPDLQVNIRSTLEQIRPDLPPDAKLDEVLEALPGRFRSAAGLSESSNPELPLRFVGYAEDEKAVKVVGMARLGESIPMHSTLNPGLDWFGYIDIASRLVKGISQLPIEGREVETGVPVEYVVPTPLMSLDDALSLAETLVDVTATFGKYVRGIAIADEHRFLEIPVGGPVQSAVVRPDGFHWTREPVWPVRPPQPSPSKATTGL